MAIGGLQTEGELDAFIRQRLGEYRNVVLRQVQQIIGGPAGGDLEGNFPDPTIRNGAVTLAKLDPAARPLRYAETIGDGATLALNVDHNLGTRDVLVAVYDTTTHVDVDPSTYTVDRATVNRVTLTFPVAPALDGVRAVVLA